MPQVLLTLAILAPLVSAFSPRNFVVNAPASPSEDRRETVRSLDLGTVVLTGEEFQGRHPCASDSVCSCYHEGKSDRPGDVYVVVDCSDRNLTKPPESLLGLDLPVGELLLHGNKLTRAPDMTRNGFDSVFALTLSSNRIKRISENTISLGLQILLLHGNRISRIDEKVMELLKKRRLFMFTLNSNPLICDCRSSGSLKILRSMRAQVRETLTCTNKIKIDDLKLDELCVNATTTRKSGH